MMREKIAVIYARVSTARQAEEELPLESQIQQCKERAAALEARVDRVFVDHGISGTHDQRPAFQDAITFCEVMGADYLITWSTSRFARNKVDAGMYKLRLAKAGTDIIYVSLNIDRSTDSGWMTEGILELFDEFYSRQVSADTTRSMVKNAQDGYFNGGRVPFGYEVYPAPDNPKRKRLKPFAPEADVVRRIFQLRIRGLGARAISMQLRDEGIKNRDTDWNKYSVGSLLRNHSVCGCVVFGRRTRGVGRVKQPREKWIIVPSHEPIISNADFDTVQQLMDKATNPVSGSPKSTHPFTGILHCEETGCTMQIETAKSGKYHYYNCRDAQKYGKGKNRRVRADLLDDWLISVILDRILTEEFLTDTLTEIHEVCGRWATDHRQRRQAAQVALDAASRKNEKIYTLFERYGRDTPNLGDLTKRLRANNKVIEKREAELRVIDAEQKPEVVVTQEDIAELAESLRYIIQTTTDQKKLRHFFQSFIGKIVVGDTSVRIEYRPECLIPNQEPLEVPSRVRWLPGTGSNCRPSD